MHMPNEARLIPSGVVLTESGVENADAMSRYPMSNAQGRSMHGHGHPGRGASVPRSEVCGDVVKRLTP